MTDLQTRIRSHMENRTRAVLILVADDLKADHRQIAHAINHMADLDLDPLSGEITHAPHDDPHDDVSGVPV